MKLLIDTDWFASIKDLPRKKQHEVLESILNYPNQESDTYLWKTVIKPTLEKGKIAYFNKISTLKQFANQQKPQKTNKKNPDTESDTGSRTERREEKIYNSRVDVCLLDTTHTHARTKTMEDIIHETGIALSGKRANSLLITPDFVFPNDPFFNAYKQELPIATNRTEQWLRKSNLVGKMISQKKLAEIIRKFAT